LEAFGKQMSEEVESPACVDLCSGEAGNNGKRQQKTVLRKNPAIPGLKWYTEEKPEANMKNLPHQYPFLFIDRIVEMESGKRAQGYKNITSNDWFLSSHNDTMPFGLIIEALAQLSAFAATGHSENLGLLSSIKNAKRDGEARCGDRLDLLFEVNRTKKGFLFGKGTGLVNGQTIVQADIGIFLQ
jgi:3-hydroxyacyl-[acyl-carrier-protein] dehydratase